LEAAGDGCNFKDEPKGRTNAAFAPVLYPGEDFVSTARYASLRKEHGKEVKTNERTKGVICLEVTTHIRVK
jgi:hypothetical protein